ncbi:MAG: redoxin domain-containing protein [Planctomycetes bacterium]|nr:redoxin domain-containing protein [Planctomycetota bacterium]
MRIVACVSLLIAGLGAVGCTASGKKPAPGSGSATGSGSGAATGTRTAGASEAETPVAPPPSPPSTALLAGQVKDKFDRIATKATILVVATREGSGPAPAPFRVQADERGFFTIPGLDPGKAYQLTAQIKDGSQVIAEGKVFAQPPDPRLLIRVSEDFVTPTTTPIPNSEPYPGDASPKPEKKKDDRPAASIGNPLTPRNDASPAPVVPAEAPIRTPDREHIGNGPPGIRRSLPANVPPPPARTGDTLPSVPEIAPEKSAPAPSPAVQPLTERRTPIPWCKLVGKRLDFGLYDLTGQPWELSRNRKGRLVLLDFWHTECPPCRAAIRHLNALQREFGVAGLEVVGIAYEAGLPEERVRRVREVQQQTGPIHYTILMGGHRDAPSSCPVRSQLEVAAHPTLFLVDEDGTVVRKFVGLDALQLHDLTLEIERRLRLRLR